MNPAGLHIKAGQQIHSGIGDPVIAEGESSQFLSGCYRRLHHLLQLHAPLQVLRREGLGHEHLGVLSGVDGHMIHLRELHGDLLNLLGLQNRGLIREIVKPIVKHPGGLGKTADIAYAMFLHPLCA